MNALSAIKVPDDPGPLKRAEGRWKSYLDDPVTAATFAGPVLTHSDWTPDNVLVSQHRAWLIDWAWPTLGAAWIDPACWVLRLMASGGHTAHEAERQASRLPAFQAADPEHFDLFAEANVRVWDEIAQSSTSDWTVKMAQAAKSWTAYRQAHLAQQVTHLGHCTGPTVGEQARWWLRLMRAERSGGSPLRTSWYSRSSANPYSIPYSAYTGKT